MPFMRWKRYSPTSRKARVLVAQASVAAYLQDSPASFFLQFTQLKKAKDLYWRATYKGNFNVSSTKNSFFLFASSRVHKQPVLFEVLAPTSLVLRGSHVQRQYRKWTTLCSKSSTIKGLLYAPYPHNREKRTLSDQPQLSRVSSTALLRCWGQSRSKMWCPSWLTLRRMPYGRGMLKIPLQSICSKEGLHYRFEQSARKLSSDKQQSTYSQVWISLGDSIPGLYCVAWLGLSHAGKWQRKDFVIKKGITRVQSNGCSHQKPLAKGGKRKIHQ
jgi:hypothetical protein